MGKDQVQIFPDGNNYVSFSSSGLSLKRSLNASAGPLFASVTSQIGGGFSGNSNEKSGNVKFQLNDLLVKEEGNDDLVVVDECEALLKLNQQRQERNKKGFKVKIANASLRRLVSGAIAGAFSRTAVAPLETIRTHLMVGSSGNSSTEVFNDIMKNEGWKGLFRGNFVNVIRVAPSKAIEVPSVA